MRFLLAAAFCLLLIGQAEALYCPNGLLPNGSCAPHLPPKITSTPKQCPAGTVGVWPNCSKPSSGKKLQ